MLQDIAHAAGSLMTEQQTYVGVWVASFLRHEEAKTVVTQRAETDRPLD